MSQFNDFIGTVIDGVRDIAIDDLAGFVADAEDDARAFVANAELKLRRRTEMLASGELTPGEFEDLVRGQVDLAVLFALTEAGVAAARLERFRQDLIELVVNKAFAFFL
jgi:hypothetical protein